jgi:hypothetical protein
LTPRSRTARGVRLGGELFVIGSESRLGRVDRCDALKGQPAHDEQPRHIVSGVATM